MAMRKVTENEIWGGSDRGVQEPISLEFLINHVPKKYAPLVSKIHHVDTQLREFNHLGNNGEFVTVPEYPKFAWEERNYKCRMPP